MITIDITFILAEISKKIVVSKGFEILIRMIAQNQVTGITPKLLSADPHVKLEYTNIGSIKRVLKQLLDKGILINKDHRYFVNTVFLPPIKPIVSSPSPSIPTAANKIEQSLVSTIKFPASELMKKYLRTIILLRRFPHLHGIQLIIKEAKFDYDHLPASFELISLDRKKQMVISDTFWGDTRIEAAANGTIMVHYSGSTPRGKRAMPPSVYLMWRANLNAIVKMAFNLDLGKFLIQSIGIGSDVNASKIFEIPKMDINTRFSEYQDTLWETYESWDEESQTYVLRTGSHYTFSPASAGDPSAATTEDKLDAYMDSLFLLSSSDNALSRLKMLEDSMGSFNKKWDATQTILHDNQQLLDDMKKGAVKQAEGIDHFKKDLDNHDQSINELATKTDTRFDSVESKMDTQAEYIVEEISAQYTVLENQTQDQAKELDHVKGEVKGLIDNITDLSAQISEYIAAADINQEEQATRFTNFNTNIMELLNKLTESNGRLEKIQSIISVSLLDIQKQSTIDRKNIMQMLSQNAEMLKVLTNQNDRLTQLEKPKRWFHFERKKR